MITLKDFLEVLTVHGADLCIEDKETGEHYLEYFDLEDIKCTEEPDYHNWLLGLQVKSYDSSSLLIVLSPYTMDETEYLIKCEYGEYETDKWYQKALNDCELMFKERLEQVKKYHKF